VKVRRLFASSPSSRHGSARPLLRWRRFPLAVPLHPVDHFPLIGQDHKVLRTPGIQIRARRLLRKWVRVKVNPTRRKTHNTDG